MSAPPDRDDLAALAKGAFEWIASVAIEVDGGSQWLELGQPFDDLYAGTAGILFGSAEARAAGVDVSAVAGPARGRLLHLVEHGSADEAMQGDSGVFDGMPGVAVALRAWSRVEADDEAGAAAAQIEDAVAARIIAAPGERGQCTDIISGDAGVVLTLLDGESDVARQGATVGADRLVALAEDGEFGLEWRMVADWPYLMPGFSHGTAGVAYALIAAGRALGRDDLIEVAVRGAEELIGIGSHADGWAVPLAIPPRPNGPFVNFGWCHGAAGTVKLFMMLNSIDPQPRWQQAIEGCLQALRDSRIPERLYPGYWDNVARCCGTAGVGQTLLDLYQTLGDQSLLDWAGTLAADVATRTVEMETGVAWSNTEHKVDPPLLAPEPGLMQGAIGVASWLARLEALRAAPTTARGALSLDPPWF